jgi:hypothetical protein
MRDSPGNAKLVAPTSRYLYGVLYFHVRQPAVNLLN